MSQAAEKSFDELTLGESVLLEDLVDRDALGEMAKSFFDLFRIPLKIFSESGVLLADASEPQALYAYLSTLARRRARVLQDVVGAVKAINPGRDGEVTHPVRHRRARTGSSPSATTGAASGA